MSNQKEANKLDDFFQKNHRREIRDIQIAPILDMLVAVIFFLLLSTSFMEFTKQTIPPSGVTTITDPVAPPPLNPKFYATQSGEQVRLILRWAGTDAGQLEKTITANNSVPVDADLIKASADLVSELKKKYPNEKSLSLSFGADVAYQKVVTIMDGVRDAFPDLILGSYDEARAISERAGKE